MRGVNLVRGLTLLLLAVPLAACSWLPFPANQTAAAPSHGHGKAIGMECSMTLVSGSSTPTVPGHVRGPVWTPSAVKRTFARLGMQPHLYPGKLFWNGVTPHPRAFFQFVAVTQPVSRTVTSGTVTVFRTDADALTALRGYGPHKRGECSVNLRVGNVLIQRTGPMDSRLQEAISRLR